MKGAHSTPPRVGIISQWYSPEPVLIPKTIADALVEDGFSVRVLTGFPSYPGGTLYPGFDARSACTSDLDGAQILRVPTFFSHDKSAARRALTFLSFAWKSTRHRAFLRDCDVVYVYGTPMTSALAAFVLSRQNRVPYVLHVQDLWPESVVDSGMLKPGLSRSLIKRAVAAGLRHVYNLAQHIVVISPGMRLALVNRGVAPEKISILLNWDANEGNALSGKPTPRETAQRIRCTYAGNIGLMQDVETIIRASAAVQDEMQIDVSIYGSGVAENAVKAIATELDARNVTFHGRVSSQEMIEVYRRSDYQLVTLKDRDVFRMTIPSKFQSSMSNGVPVITTVAGDLAKICEENQLGLVADPESTASLADAFRRAAELGSLGRENMATRAREFYWENLAAAKAIESIRAILVQAATSKTGSSNEAQ